MLSVVGRQCSRRGGDASLPILNSLLVRWHAQGVGICSDAQQGNVHNSEIASVPSALPLTAGKLS